MTLIKRGGAAPASSSVNYLDDPAIGAYFAAREHYAYFRSLKSAPERRDFHDKLIPVLRTFLERAGPSSYSVLDGIIGRTIHVRTPQSIDEVIALARRSQPDGLDLLELPPGVNFDELRKAYKRAALRHHPDRGGTNAQMAAINAAYEVMHAALSAHLAAARPALPAEEEPSDTEPQSALDYIWCTKFRLFELAVDDWALDDASDWLGQLRSESFEGCWYAQSDERWIELTKPAADLAKRWIAAGSRSKGEAALEIARTGVARARKNGLTFDSYLDSAEKAVAGKDKPRFGLNHRRQVENAFRYGAIDLKKHTVILQKLAAQRSEQEAERARHEERLSSVSFVPKLPIDPAGPHALPTRQLVPSPDYFQVRTEDLSPDQLAEYRAAFATPAKLALVKKYAYVRLSSLIRSAIYYPDGVDCGTLAMEARTLSDVVPKSAGYATPVAEVLDILARFAPAGRRNFAGKLQTMLEPERLSGEEMVVTLQQPDTGALTPSFLDEAVRIGTRVLAGKPVPSPSPQRRQSDANRITADELDAFNARTKARIENGDLDAIADAVEFHADDIDGLLVFIEVGGWLKKLIDAKKLTECAASIARINELLDDLIEERRRHRIYGHQTVSYYRHQKERFNKGLGTRTFPGRGPIDVRRDPEDVLKLLETVRRFERPANPGFLERVGDGCVAAGRTAEARSYYAAAIEAAVADGRPSSTVERIRRKEKGVG